MSEKITRRDFLNGVALTTGAGVLAPSNLWALESLEADAVNATYPPTLTGMRGSHAGSFEVAHALARGRAGNPRAMMR